MQSWIRNSTFVAILAAALAAFAPAPLLASSSAAVENDSSAPVANGFALSGTICDSLGAVIANAEVELLRVNAAANEDGNAVQSATADSHGRYAFALASPGRYYVRAQAASFQPAESAQQYLTGEHNAQIDLVLSPSIVTQEIVVTATGVPTPEVQTGASVGVIGEEQLATRINVEQELRLQPGAQLSREGQFGAQTSMFLRGAPSDSTKVVIDGIPVNDIGGAFNFANLSAGGYENAELYRGPDSALYGVDALAGVLVLKTREGETPLPEMTYAADGGTLGTLHEEGSVGGAWRRFDYFADLNRIDTHNSTPNSAFHNASALANFGWKILPSTSLRVTGGRSASAFNSANAIDLYGIPDDAVSREFDTSFNAALENRPSERWHNLVSYNGFRLRSPYTNFGPTGIPATDPYGYPIFLGKNMTITGANGYQVTGQGVLQFSPYPYRTALLSNRDSVFAQTDYRWNEHLAGVFGFRYEAESGYENFGFENLAVSRGNYSYMMLLHGGFASRLYYTAASGLENNALFGFAATPRASLAYYLIRPNNHSVFSGTRLSLNFGKGIKDPSIYDETNSLYEILQTLPAQSGYPTGSQLIQQYGIRPFRYTQSRTYDGGVQQLLLRGRAKLSATYFHNEFGDQSEFIPAYALTEFGIDPQLISTLSQMTQGGFGGAELNTLAYRAQGVELEGEYHITRNVAVRGGWTYTDAVVQKSFSGSPANASYNLTSSFSTIPIGAFSPLIGARPFRIAPNTGFFAVDWSTRRFTVRGTGTLVSRRDDSDFLFDASYGNSLLLPNRNLDPAYQKIDLYGSFRVNSRMSMYTSMENLLNQRYYETFGYPALPFTIRSGVQFKFGGESWKL